MLRPLGNRILVRPEPNPETTESGLHLVEHRKPETHGYVVEVPERVPCECPDCGGKHFRVADVRVGDEIVFSWQAGLEVYVDGDRYLILAESDIAAVLEGVS